MLLITYAVVLFVFAGAHPLQFSHKFETLMMFSYSLGRAKYLPLGNVANMVVQAKVIIDELVRLATRADTLSEEREVMKEMQAGVDECMLTRQPVLAALFLHKRLTPAADMDAKVDLSALRSELEEIRFRAGMGETGFAEFHGWRDSSIPFMGGAGGSPSYGVGNDLGSRQASFQLGFGAPMGHTGNCRRQRAHDQSGHYHAPPSGWHKRSAGDGRAQAGRTGHRQQPGAGRGIGAECMYCSRSGFPADHSHHVCPHGVCHKCGHIGHLWKACPR